MAAQESLSEFTFKVASAPELEEALVLRRIIYERQWGYTPDDEIDARAIHFVAVSPTGEIGAACRMVLPDARPFEIEQFVSLSELDQVVAGTAEVGRFFVQPQHRHVSRDHFLQFGMLKMVFRFAQQAKISTLLMYTLPQLVRLFEVGFFEQVGRGFYHSEVDQEMLVMRLDICAATERHERSAGRFSKMILGPLPRVIL